MFDKNSLNKLTEAIPEEMKDKLKKGALDKLGFSSSESAKTEDAATTPSEKVTAQAPSDDTSDVQVDANQPEPVESTGEDSDAA